MYNLIAAGGTFDLLHKGHKTFLKSILDESDKVVLGLTSDLYTKSFKNGKPFNNYLKRKEELEDFLLSINAKDKVEIIPIDDIYGPLSENKYNPQAIFVTKETQDGAIKINEKRKELGLEELEIIVLPMELAEDGIEISSTRIRNGEINRNGKLFIKPKWKNKTLLLPENIRADLKKPFGEILSEIPSNLDNSNVITIGDVTTQKFNNKNVNQFLSIIDFLVKREKVFDKLSDLGFEENIETINAENPQGEITPDLIIAIQNAFKSNTRKVILVNGEEDLAVLPVLLIAPLGFVIFYGQPDEGLVQVYITEENKEKAFEIVNKFNS